MPVKPKARMCFRCKSDQHLLANCPVRSVVRASEDRPTSTCVNACISLGTRSASIVQAHTDRSADVPRPVGEMQSADGPCSGLGLGLDACSGGSGAWASVQSSVALTNDEINSVIQSMRLLPLKSVKVVINEKCCAGAQIVLLNKSVLTDDVCTVSKIQVQGVFGDTVTADITPVDVKCCNDDTDDRGLCMLNEPMQIFLWLS